MNGSEAAGPSATLEGQPPAAAPMVLPASFAQERLWFFAQLVPDLGVYNIGCPFERADFGPRLDPDVVRNALATVVRRHETLRTCLGMRDGELVQLIHPEVPVHIQQTDLRGLPAAERQARAEEIVTADAAAPIPLDSAPLWRARLIRHTDEDWSFVIVVHHAVFDAYSAGNLVSELLAAYRALIAGIEPELPELAIQYADFAAWQRQRLAAGELDSQLEYWKGALADLPGPFELPSEIAARPSEPNHHLGGSTAFGLPAEIGQQVEELARTKRTTPFVVLLSGFAALLSRLTGRTDLVVGSPVSGRLLPELGPLMGMFVNTLVLRIGCGGDPGFGELVERVRGTVIDALDNQEIPYDRLAEVLAPNRTGDGMPLHQVVFNLLPLRTNSQIRNGTSKVDLLLDLARVEEGYDGQLEYRSHLLTQADAAAFGTRLGRLLAAGLATPELAISRLPILDEAERQLALAAGLPPGKPAEAPLITELFAARVLAAPDSTAVRDAAGRRLSYRELDRRSDELASRLASVAPAGPDAVVGILVETGIELPVAVLGVLKTGAAYLPLDQQHPAERMRFLLTDAGAVAVVSQTTLAARLPDLGLAEVRVDEIRGEELRAGEIRAGEIRAEQRSASAAPRFTPHRRSLAYVIYTSGSTGEPKGVGVEHGQLAGYLDEVIELLGLAPGRSFVLLQSLTFDFGLTMFYGALGSGGTLHIISREFAADAYWVGEYLRRERADYLKITPSHLRALQAGGDAAALLPSRGLLLGGEASSWDWVRSLRATGCPVLNHYGPTETTVGALAYPGNRWPEGEPPTTPLGWPLARARAYLLDQWLQPVPDGVPGELFLGGSTVSRGYLGRPAQTAGRFLPDPFAGEPGARMYRTGDRARRRRDGSVEFLGRLDDQVKVRGYRVELGEVQHVLSGAPGVGQCAVVLQGGPTDAEAPDSEPQIVGYVVPATDAGSRPAVLDPAARFDPAALRDFVAERLPDYMVPACFVPMAELPLAAHGKLDRSRLPRPDGAGGSSAGPAAEAFDPPRGATEDLVASVFERLLDRQHIGRTEGFFALGGHSLLAIQMVTRLRTAFGVAIPLRAVFEDPTVAGIAGQIQARLARRAGQLPAVRVLPRGGPLPTSYGQRRLWFLDQLESANTLYNTPVCFRVTGRLDPELLRRGLTAVVERHEVLRSRFVEQDGELMQLVAAEAEVPFEQASASDQAAAAELLARSAERRFDLDREPPLRVLLVGLANDQHLLLITLHHLVNDAWSANLLASELVTCYQALGTGESPELAELPVQYADFAAWQRDLVTGPLRESQLAYWRNRLAGMPQQLALPTDRPRPARRSYRGEHVPFRVPAATVDRLRALGADENASLFMVLLTAFLVLLGRYTGEDDVVVGTPASSRTRPEFESLLGFFLNTLVLRTDCSGNPSFRELLQRVRTTALEAFANSDVPFEALVDELAPRRDLGSTPLVQVLFTLEDAERRPIMGDGIELRWEPFGTATAKFDITLYLWRRADGLSGAVEYRTDLFDHPTMERFASLYQALLDGAAAEPDRPGSELPMLTDADVAALDGWNATELEWTGPESIPAMLAGRAAADPDATALVWQGAEVSYREFAGRVNRLARLLIEQGVRVGDVVGVLLDRGTELLVSVHAIMAAGAAYLPLDPGYPAERLAFQCTDVRVALVVTTSELAGRLPEQASTDRLLLDISADRLAELADGPLPIEPPADTLAYVIHTSGSTGRPKAAGVSQRAIVNRLRWMQQAFPLGPADRVLHKTPCGFDVSVWELCWPLMFGSGIVIAEPDGHRDPGYLARLMAEQRVSTVHFVPSMLGAFLTEPDLGQRLPALRRIICSGEALPAALVRACTAALPQAELHNLYGPTEAAVDVTWHRCLPTDDPVPIGSPIANTRLHVLDRHGARVPVGVPGELCLAGVQLAHGYLGRPGLTAARFTPDPYGPPGSRMYSTGDLGRWLPTGEIEYRGRLDDQVKVRGMRVEPGETEAALSSLPEVRAAAVVPHSDAEGVRLIAYLTASNPADPPSPELLRRRLAALLPEQSVPVGYHLLDELPLSANGKLDRAALPEPVLGLPAKADYVEPATEPERAVAEIWAAVLGAPQVGAEDDFFALGGDSIRALKVLARLRAAGYPSQLTDLFLHQNVRALAATLDRRGGSAPALPEPIAPFGLLDPITADVVRARFAAEDAYPLAALQAGMLFHSEYSEDAATYHDVFTLRLSGSDYRPAAMASAVAEVGARHAILRTSLHVADFAEPVQVVHPRAEIPIRLRDLRELPAELVGAELSAFLDAEKRTRFEPDLAPLLRIFVHLLPDTEFALTLSFHHAILDGWSVATLTTELLQRYHAHSVGNTLATTPPELSYRDFVAEQLDRIAAAESTEFWQAQLADAPGTEVPRLPGFRRTQTATGDAAVLAFELGDDLVAGLGISARSARVPVRTVLMSAHLRALGLLNGADDVVTGIVTHGKSAHEAGDRVLGLFLNTIPIRARLDQSSWLELMRAVYAAEVAAMPHRSYPLAEIQRRTGRSPVYDVLFDYRDFHVYGELPSDERLRITGYTFFEQTNVPFAVNLIRSGTGRLTLQLKYDSSQFPAAQVAAIGRLYLRMLAAAAGDLTTDPRPTAGYLGDDLARIEGWNATRQDYPASTVPELFADAARRFADLPAVLAAGQPISYAELAARVNRLAGRLINDGVRPGDVVGICLERGLDLVVAVHAVLTAGAAYLPLEPDYPPRRLAELAEDADVRMILTTGRLTDRLTGRPTLALDVEAERIRSQPAGPPGVPIAAESLAYVLYTSGSTGRPKGVGVSHRAIANRLRWMQDSYPLTERDAVLHKTPFSFDVSVWELCWPLLVGARMVVADAGGHRSPDYLVELIREQRVSVAHFVPSMLEALLAEPDLPDRLATLRHLVCSGEALRPELAARARTAVPSAELHNLYGPTEAAVDVTQYTCRAGEEIVPIGRPVPNTRIEILDGRGERLPIGAPGELCIGGVQVATGYISRPSLTAERFVPDPHGDPGCRLYRTGDLARWLPDGTVEYLGRLDRQVKIRGFRIELGEVEAALVSQPDVRSAAVVAAENSDGSRRLVGYLVAEPATAELPLAELADRLRKRLPEYLVPGSLIQLAELPLTRSGKLDQSALPAPDPRATVGYVPNETPTEQVIAEVFGEVLDVDPVGAEDDFFAMGGDSIRSLKVIARLREHGHRLAVGELFGHPTVRRLAAMLDEAASRAGTDSRPEAPVTAAAFGLLDPRDLALLTRRSGDGSP